MPRRKKTDTHAQIESSQATSATATLPESPPPTTVEAAAADSHAEPRAEAGAPVEGERPKNWGDPYKATFTCPAKRFELGENRRFKQMVFRFAENPGPEVTQKLKDAGFKYRGNEKAWTAQVTPAVRELATKLAHELGGEAAAMSR